jgi:hypothetical protein
MKQFIIGEVEGKKIFFSSKCNPGMEDAIIVTNSGGNGDMSGEPIIVPEKFFYPLFGKEMDEALNSILRLRLPVFAVFMNDRKPIIEYTFEFEKKLYLQGNRVVFSFPAGVTLALRMSEEVTKNVQTLLEIEKSIIELDRKRTQEAVVYFQALKEGRSPGFSLL